MTRWTALVAVIVFCVIAGTCSGCGFPTPSAPLNRTIVDTSEGPVAIWHSTLPPNGAQQDAIRSEVEEGYRDGRALWGFDLPGTSTFDVRVVEGLDGNAAGYYYPNAQTIVCDAHGANGYCDALDDDLQHHFCHWGRELGAVPLWYNCARYWEYLD